MEQRDGDDEPVVLLLDEEYPLEPLQRTFTDFNSLAHLDEGPWTRREVGLYNSPDRVNLVLGDGDPPAPIVDDVNDPEGLKHREPFLKFEAGEHVSRIERQGQLFDPIRPDATRTVAWKESFEALAAESRLSQKLTLRPDSNRIPGIELT